MKRSTPEMTVVLGLLDRSACLRECLCQSRCHFARLVFDQLPESGGDLRLCDVDVGPGGHGGRAMPHQAGQRNEVHVGALRRASIQASRSARR